MKAHKTTYFQILFHGAWILLSIIASTESANVLVLIPLYAKSHYISISPIGLELARRGHNVTVLTSFREKNPPPNYHEIELDKIEIWNALGIENPNIFDLSQMSGHDFHQQIFYIGGLRITEVALKSKSLQEFLKKDNKFDLVIGEQFYQEAFNILAYKYKAPLVLMSTFGNCMKHNLATRNPLQMANVISEHWFIENPKSFLGRLKNLYTVVNDYVNWRFWYLGEQEKLVKKYLPGLEEPIPSLYDVQKNVSLFLINSHYSYYKPFALLPNIIEIGGIHLKDDISKLPEDLQKLLDESKHGVVYVNFGSNVKSSDLPEEKKKAFLNVFRRLKQTVLWKWEDDVLEDQPKNVVIRKWMPQREILAHPNIQLFFCHGGLIGMQEAIYNGIPLVGVPVYGDQYNNLLLIQEAGAGKILNFQDINEKNIENVLKEVLSNESYLKTAKDISRRFKDRPMTPLDTAMYWLEYVIRHNGADFIKNHSRDMNWFSYNMFDVYAFVVFIFFIFIFTTVKIILLLKAIVFKKNKEKVM